MVNPNFIDYIKTESDFMKLFILIQNIFKVKPQSTFHWNNKYNQKNAIGFRMRVMECCKAKVMKRNASFCDTIDLLLSFNKSYCQVKKHTKICHRKWLLIERIKLCSKGGSEASVT